MEEMGMTGMRFKSHLRGVVSNLEGVGEEAAKAGAEEAAKKLDKMTQRFRPDIES